MGKWWCHMLHFLCYVARQNLQLIKSLQEIETNILESSFSDKRMSPPRLERVLYICLFSGSTFIKRIA